MVVEGKESLDTLMTAIKTILEDSTFEVKCEVAAEARKVAVDLLAWCSNQADVDKCYLNVCRNIFEGIETAYSSM